MNIDLTDAIHITTGQLASEHFHLGAYIYYKLNKYHTYEDVYFISKLNSYSVEPKLANCSAIVTDIWISIPELMLGTDEELEFELGKDLYLIPVELLQSQHPELLL